MSGVVVAKGFTRTVAASFTRPNDTSAYAIGDVISNSTSASTIITFANVADSVRGGGILQQVTLIVGEYQTTKLNADLFLFDTAPADYGVDNAAFTPTDAELATCVGVVNLDGTSTTPYYIHGGDLTSGASGNCIIEVTNLGIPFNTKLGDNSIYGVMVARNAYTPAASCPFTIRIHVLE